MNASSTVQQSFSALKRELSGLVSLLVFLGVTAFLFRSWEFALIVTASLGFHELGHAAALAFFGLEYRISFGWAGAWTWSRLSERQALSHFQNSCVHLAGPMFSLLLAFIALALYLLWLPNSDHLLLLSNFTAQVGLLNLLPLGALTDGGKLLQRVALSVRAGQGRQPILLLITLSVLGPILYALYEIYATASLHLPTSLLVFILIGAWLGASFLAEVAGQSDPTPQAAPMTFHQIALLILLLWDMLAVLFIIIFFTPFWLAPQYLLGSLKNAEALLRLFTHLLTLVFPA